MIEFREQLLARFRWINGHADILGLLAEDDFLERAALALWQPFATAEVTKVTGVEARGLYPLYDRFNEIRRQLDPNGTFANRFIHALFGS